MPRSPRLGKTLNGSIVPEQGQQGNPPAPEEAGEIILISLCHFGTKGNGVDKKRKGASSTEGVGSQGVPCWGTSKRAVPGSRLHKQRLTAALGKPRGFFQPFSDFRFSPLLAPLGFSRVRHALTMSFSCAFCQALASTCCLADGVVPAMNPWIADLA